MVMEQANHILTVSFIKQLNLTLKSGTSDSRKDWFAVGAYKKLPNKVGSRDTVLPEKVSGKMSTLLKQYNAGKSKTLTDIIDFMCNLSPFTLFVTATVVSGG